MFYVKIENEEVDRDPNTKMLQYTFHNKCYICEDEAIKDGTKEHRIPKAVGETFDSLSNLFWACSRCNLKKGNRFYELSNKCKHTDGYCGIIDCTKCDPNEYVSIKVSQDLKVEINIVEKKYAPCIKNTVSLLREVYCPTGRMDTIKLGALKGRIIDQLDYLANRLRHLYVDYMVSPEMPQREIDKRKKEIMDCLSPGKPFFALKLSYIEEMYNQHSDSGFGIILEDILKDPSFHPVVDDCCGCFPPSKQRKFSDALVSR